MADMGFLTRDLLKKRAKLIIQLFTSDVLRWRGNTCQHLTSLIKTRNTPRFRIHVEKAIGRLKSFGILSNTISLDVKPLANQMIPVCAFLCNLQKSLVKKNKRI